jgi:hypothetical protein
VHQANLESHDTPILRLVPNSQGMYNLSCAAQCSSSLHLSSPPGNYIRKLKFVKTRHLIILLSISGLWHQVISSDTSLGVNLLLHGNLGKVAKNVLHLAVGSAALSTSEVVEPRPLVEKSVDDGNNNGDADGVDPDNNDGDNVGVTIDGESGGLGSWVGRNSSSATEPAEDTEEGCENIDTEDGANQLPSWPCVGSTGDEDEPVLSKGDLEEEHALDTTVQLDDTTVGEVDCASENPCTKRKEGTEDDGDDPDLWQLPLDRSLFEMCVIVSDARKLLVTK